MSFEKLHAVKRYLNSHLTKKFIQASSVFYSSLVIFVKKSGGEIRFYVNYKRLNVIIKKDYYPIPRIKKIVT